MSRASGCKPDIPGISVLGRGPIRPSSAPAGREGLRHFVTVKLVGARVITPFASPLMATGSPCRPLLPALDPDPRVPVHQPVGPGRGVPDLEPPVPVGDRE